MTRHSFVWMLVIALVAALTTAHGMAQEPQIIDIGGPPVGSTDPVAVNSQSGPGTAFSAASDHLTVAFPAFGGKSPITITATNFGPLAMATTRLLAVDADGKITSEWTAASTVPDAEENVVSYRQIIAGVDDVFTVFQTRLKHETVLNWPMNWPANAAALGVESRLVLPDGTRLTDETGQPANGRAQKLYVLDGNGKLAYSMPPVVAWDAAGIEIEGWYDVRAADANTIIVRAMFRTAELANAAYPVRLDPTINVPGSGGNFIPWEWVHNGTWPQGAVYQQAITATQMQNTAGVITSIGFHMNNMVSNTTVPNLTVIIGETTNTSAASAFASNYNAAAGVVVFDGPYTFSTAVANDYSLLVLTTPFTYSGTNALCVELRISPGITGAGILYSMLSSGVGGAWRSWSNNVNATSNAGALPNQGTEANFMGFRFVIADGPTISAPAGNSLTSVAEGQTVSTQFTATGGTPPYTWSATGLPTGVTMSSTGLLSGAPAGGSAGTYNVDVTVTDSRALMGNKIYSWVITVPPIQITTPAGGTIPEAYEGDAINLQFAATGGVAPYNWSAAGLPTGVSLSASGLLSGTLAQGSAGDHTVTVTITDSNNSTVNPTLSWTVYALPVPTGVLPNATEGFAYNHTLAVTGGKAPFTWTLNASPSLPAGLSFSPATGVLSGTPAMGDAGTYSLTLTVSDANARQGNGPGTLVINPEVSITLASLPAGTDTGNYGPVTVTTSGGVGPFVFGATGLPAGLSINPSTGDISGTIPANTSANSPFSVTLTVADTNAFAAQAVLNLAVNAVPTLSVSTLPTGALGTPYTGAQLTANGGTAPFTWQVTGLPQGLTANANGQISGNIDVTNAAGDYTVTITVTDANGVSNMVTATMKLIVGGGNISVRGCGMTAGQSLPWYGVMWLLVVVLAAIRRHATRESQDSLAIAFVFPMRLRKSFESASNSTASAGADSHLASPSPDSPKNYRSSFVPSNL